MFDSILDTVKKFCNVSPDDDSFDVDILVDLNTAFGVLYQLGATKDSGFMVTDGTMNWDDYTSDKLLLNFVRGYVCIKTKLVFDPPTGAALTAYEEKASELEWRIREHCEMDC